MIIKIMLLPYNSDIHPLISQLICMGIMNTMHMVTWKIFIFYENLMKNELME